ncbi:hypothetical protein DV738_g3251, partial [Chaetothyriales sp. CBS 135597]
MIHDFKWQRILQINHKKKDGLKYIAVATFMDTADSSEESHLLQSSYIRRFNEADRLKERYVRFQPTELQRIAGEAMQLDSCPPDIAKLAEGGFNKVFTLRAKNGREEVLARIPTPIAGPAHYTTANEVATMDFLRVVLNLPVPEVLAYSTTSDNPVGAEYILMERIEGESLSSRWLSLTTDEVIDIMTQIAEMEKKIFDFRFPAYGSLYYKTDLDDEEVQIPVVDDFVVGPVASRQFWHGERSKTEIDRGPWLSAVDCVTSAARREMAIIQHHAKPQPRQTFLLPTTHNIHPSEHTSLLSQFLQLAPCIIPPGSYTAPTLRHPDLSLSNILLAPGSSKIVGIIDWQDAVILPRFMQAGYPAFCQHDNPSQPQSLQIPSLPDDFDNMGVDEQRQCKTKFRLEEANLYYTAATGVHHEEHMKVLRMPHLGMLQYLLRQTGYPWDADVINLRAALVGITTPAVWANISSAPDCPVVFSNEERETAMAESREWNESEQLLSRVRAHLGIDLEGGTEPDNFERAVEGNRQFRMEMLTQAEPDQREVCAAKNGIFTHYNTAAPTEAKRILPLFSLKGKTAIISGGGAGIGLAVARGYAEAGANVIIWYNSNKEAVARAAEIEQEFPGVRAAAYQVDVRNADEVDRAITTQIQAEGFNNRLDVFVANSGIPWTQGPMITGSLEHYRNVIATDVDGVFYCARTAGRIWQEQKKKGLQGFTYGSFVATASMSGHIANFPQLQTAYNGAKAAVRHMCKSLALEWVQFARANSISPGYIRTEISNFVPDDIKASWRDKIPMGREGEPIELVGAYLYLASDASSYTTGTDFLIDGGYCIP